MDSKSVATLLIIIVCILLFPVAIGIIGGVFGLVGGILGAIFGAIGGVIGAIFGVIGAIFGAIFGFIGWLFDGEIFQRLQLCLGSIYARSHQGIIGVINILSCAVTRSLACINTTHHLGNLVFDRPETGDGCAKLLSLLRIVHGS